MSGRHLLLLLIPPAVFGAIVFLALSAQYREASMAAGARYGQSTADQLAHHLVQHVVKKDLLSLNVVVSRLVNAEHSPFIAVYDEANKLIAQAGRESRADASFISEMSFQDSTIGFVRVAVRQPPLEFTGTMVLLVFLFGVYALALWRNQELIEGLKQLLDLKATIKKEPEGSPQESLIHMPDNAQIEHSLLVVRVRPAHYMERHFDKFFRAAKLHHGIVEQTTTEELVIHFESADALYLATCAGYLIREITRVAGGNIRFGGTLTMVDEDSDRQRKAASYLASLADNELLVTSGADLLASRCELQRFHHSLVDSKDIRKLVSLEDSLILTDQARQINSDTA